jgi:hypothetical protein
MISVLGESTDYSANARLRVFNGTNKLEFENQVSGSLAGKGQFKYYWFLSNGAKDAA